MSASVIGRSLGLALAMAVVLSVGVATVESAIPNNCTYYACLTKKTGAVKVINYPKVKCATGQQLIKWNAKGPAGPQGAQGEQGPKGDPGPAGTSGSSDWGDIANKPADLADGQIGWGEVKNKPDDLTDGQIGWGEIANKPAGFADGVDDGTFVSQTYGPYQIPEGGTAPPVDIGPFSPNVDVDISVIPLDVPIRVDQVIISRSGTGIYHQLWVDGMPADAGAFKIRVRAYSEGISPAGLKQQLKNVTVTLKKVKRSR